MGTRCSLSPEKLTICCSVGCSLVLLQVIPSYTRTRHFTTQVLRFNFETTRCAQSTLKKSKPCLYQARKKPTTSPKRAETKRARPQEWVLLFLRVPVLSFIGSCHAGSFCQERPRTISSCWPTPAGRFEPVGRRRHNPFTPCLSTFQT